MNTPAVDALALDTLVSAREILSERSRWCQGAPALDATGDAVEAESDAAVCWCLTGALDKVADFDSATMPPVMGVVYDMLFWELPGCDFLTDFNDCSETQHADVLRVLDGAIAKLKEKD